MTMKNRFALLLVLMVAFSFSGCNQTNMENIHVSTTTGLNELCNDMPPIDDITAEFSNTFDVSDKIVVENMAVQPAFMKVFSDLESVYLEASNVVVGIVTDVQHTDDNAAPRTIYSFHVSETLKGDILPNSLISVSESNGYVRLSTFIDVYGNDHFTDLTEAEISNSVILQSVEGAPLPGVGEEYVIFLGNRKEEGRLAGAYSLIGNFMGKYVLDSNTKLYGRYIPSSNPDFYSIGNINSRTSTVEQPMSLETMKTIIAGLT